MRFLIPIDVAGNIRVGLKLSPDCSSLAVIHHFLSFYRFPSTLTNNFYKSQYTHLGLILIKHSAFNHKYLINQEVLGLVLKLAKSMV